MVGAAGSAPAARVLVGETVEAAGRRRALEAIAAATPGLPALTAGGHLPAGIHDASMGAFVARFGTNEARLLLLDQLATSVELLHDGGGLRRLLVGGSFIDDKLHPGDIDTLFVPTGDEAADMATYEAAFGIEEQGLRVHLEAADTIVVDNGMGNIPVRDANDTMLDVMTRSRHGELRGLVALTLDADSARELRAAIAQARAAVSQLAPAAPRA